MNSGTFQNIWESNKKFLLIVGAGLVVFLYFKSCTIGPYATKASGENGTISRNQRIKAQVQRLHKEVRGRFNNEKNNVEEYSAIEKDYLQQYSIVLSKNIQPFKKGGSNEVQISKRVRKIWGEVNTRARQINCKLPNMVSLRQLGVKPDDTEYDLERHARSIELLRRALSSMVRNGVVKISTPRVHEESELNIKGNSEKVIVFQKIEFDVRASYKAFVEILKECQKPGQFIQVLIDDLDPRRGGGSGLLRCRLEFSGFYFDEIQDK